MKQDNQEQLKITLQSFGWSEKEAIVYISLLELGKGTVAEISRKAGINRTNGYNILDSLTGKGVVSVSGKEPKQEYAAESPETITAYLKRVADQTAEQIRKSEELVPELTLLHAKKNRPKIKFYEGIEGLKHVYEDTLTSSETIRAFANVDDVENTLPDYSPNYYKRRAAKNIAIRAIFPMTKGSVARSGEDAKEKRESAFIPAEKYRFSPEINIYNNKVMIASWYEKLGIIIESEEIADAMKNIYELAWAEAKRLDTQIRAEPTNQTTAP